MSISNTPLLEIDGQPLPAEVAALLISAYVDDSQRTPDMFSLRFRDPARTVLSMAKATIGAKAKVSVMTAGAQTPEPLIEGEITAVEAEFDTGGSFTVIRGYDQAHRLFRGRRTVSYVQMTASDIASKVAQRAGLKVGTVTATRTVFPHLSQSGQTDWDVLQQLTRDNGFEVAVRDGQFSFGPPAPAAAAPAAGNGSAPNPLVLELGRDLLRIRSVVSSAQQVGKVEVRGWDVATKQPLTTTVPAQTRSAELPTVTPENLAKTFGDPVYVGTDVPYRTQAEVDEAAGSLAEEIAGTFAELEGVALGNPKVRAGASISISGLGEPFDGKYTVTTSRHRFDDTGYTTSFSVTGRQNRTLLGLASGGAARAAPAPVVIGIVDDVADPEKQARVKLQFPWLDADYVSDWARTMQLGAGQDRGTTFLPEVGDEVLVCFEQGDFRRPVVLGGLFNGVDTVPSGPADLVDSGSGAVNRRSVVSRRGHRVDLLDADGKTEGVRVATTGDTLLVNLDHTKTTITVHADGKVLIEGTQGVTIDSAGSAMELKGSSISLKATGGVTVDGGGGAVSVKSGSQLTLDGGGMATLKAGMVKIN